MEEIKREKPVWPRANISSPFKEQQQIGYNT